MTEEVNERPEKERAAICGLFCEACTAYIASTDDPERLTYLSGLIGLDEDEIRCYGCRSDELGFYCKECEMKTCAEEQKVEFCSECENYPCKLLSKFQGERAHRIELFEDGREIKEKGCQAWMAHAREKYSCPDCSTINSAYDFVCRKCGREPANEFVAKHKEKIQEFMKDR